MRRIKNLGGPQPSSHRAAKRIRFILLAVLVGAVATLAYPWVFPQMSRGGLTREEGMHWYLVGLQKRIEQFKASSPDGQYPDLVGKGWEVMFDPNGDGDFSDSCLYWRLPENIVNNQTAVWILPSPNTGWHYDRATGVLGACYFDEATSTFTNTP